MSDLVGIVSVVGMVTLGVVAIVHGLRFRGHVGPKGLDVEAEHSDVRHASGGRP